MRSTQDAAWRRPIATGFSGAHQLGSRLRHGRPATPRPAGDYAEQCRIGRQEAEALIDRISDEGAPFLLGLAAQEMLAAPWGGRQIGFFHAIAERLR